MILSLDLTSIQKAHKSLTDPELAETQAKSNQEESIPFISENIGIDLHKIKLYIL